jgi:hypothetical protein
MSNEDDYDGDNNKVGYCYLYTRTLLSNGLVNEFPRRQTLGKQSVARLRKNRGGCVFPCRPRQATVKQRCYAIRFLRVSRVEAGSNTSTVTLRVAGGDEKGSLKSERVKYGREYQETRIRERLRWQGPAAKNRPVLSSERAPTKNKTVTVKQ